MFHGLSENWHMNPSQEFERGRLGTSANGICNSYFLKISLLLSPVAFVKILSQLFCSLALQFILYCMAALLQMLGQNHIISGCANTNNGFISVLRVQCRAVLGRSESFYSGTAGGIVLITQLLTILQYVLFIFILQ